MKTLALLGLLVVCSLSHAVTAGDQAPAWQGTDLVSGADVQFPAVLEDRPAVLLFWATWCPYCKAFMPYAKKLQAEFADRGVSLITLNSKERGRGDPAAYARSLEFPLIAIGAADDIGAAYAVDFIPGLMVVDGAGQVIYRRQSTDLPAGRTVAQQWYLEVRAALIGELHGKG
ncbi:MAG: redoxin family protein [Pseudomonadota bacterium]